ncbi:MAG: hypothetical protein Q7S61_00225 [bacterium]|nr:hypothetical protein [bacterium]
MKSQKGQVLLIIVMLLATAITVVLSITFKATTDIQLSKLEEENQKALAAAEAGIEEALRTSANVVSIGSLSIGLAGFEGSAIITTAVSNTFVSPLLQEDQQYTFYLSNYPALDGSFSGNTSIWYGSEGTNCDSMAVEVTYIYKNSSGVYQMNRYLADSGSKLGSGGTDKLSVTSINSALDTTTFQCKTQNLTVPTVVGSAPTVLIVRTLFAATRLGFRAEDPGAYLKPQGKYVTSEAMNTNTKVTKKIQLFQSYPQLPMEFFITSF